MPTLKAIVADYVKWERRAARAERRWYANHPSLKSAVESAALAQGLVGEELHPGKHPHQWRLPHAALREARVRLMRRLPEIQRCRSFNDLHDLLLEVVAGVDGLGELYAYDTAARIGARLGLAPKQVYLHRGTREGARNLGFEPTRKAVRRNELPVELRALPADEIENLLCIYKAQLAGAALANRRGNCARVTVRC